MAKKKTKKAVEEKRWRTYRVYGPDYAEVFGPKPLYKDADRIVLGSQEDADLIAAAPRLLKELKYAVKQLRKLGVDTTTQRQAIKMADRKNRIS